MRISKYISLVICFIFGTGVLFAQNNRAISGLTITSEAGTNTRAIEGSFVYTPDDPLNPGTPKFTVTVTGDKGTVGSQQITTNTFSVTITEPKINEIFEVKVIDNNTGAAISAKTQAFVDNTAPTADGVARFINLAAGEIVPADPKALLANIKDNSGAEVTVVYDYKPEPLELSRTTARIKLTDNAGNSTIKDVDIAFINNDFVLSGDKKTGMHVDNKAFTALPGDVQAAQSTADKYRYFFLARTGLKIWQIDGDKVNLVDVREIEIGGNLQPVSGQYQSTLIYVGITIPIEVTVLEGQVSMSMTETICNETKGLDFDQYQRAEVGDVLKFKVTVANGADDSTWKTGSITMVLPEEVNVPGSEVKFTVDGAEVGATYVQDPATHTIKATLTQPIQGKKKIELLVTSTLNAEIVGRLVSLTIAEGLDSNGHNISFGEASAYLLKFFNMPEEEGTKVGINTQTPEANLDIKGDLRITKEVRAGGNAGKLGQILMSFGKDNPVEWTDNPLLELKKEIFYRVFSVAKRVDNKGGIENPSGESGAGSGLYSEDIAPNITGIKEITGLTTSFPAAADNSKVVATFQTTVSKNNTSNWTSGSCQLYMDDKMKGVKVVVINKKGSKNLTVTAIVDGVPKGEHTMKVFCGKRKSSGTSNLSFGTLSAIGSTMTIEVLERFVPDPPTEGRK